jgi:GDP-4-dehydro-6-deoxy-D-mannose reductase
MRLLITGITGFVGSHLAEYALTQGADVAGSLRWRSPTQHIDHLRDRLTLLTTDLRDAGATRALVAAARPDAVVHLAAQSFVGASWDMPAETVATNTLCQVHLLEALRELRPAARVVIAGSGEEYGLVEPDELPIREGNPLRPLSPYAVSKVAQDLLGYQYFKSYGQPIVRARAFNHTGPRRGDAFATSSFARQIAEIEAGRRPPVVEVGDLKPTRDFLDVRDVVRGYWLLLEHGTPGEVYNLCSGREWSIEQVLQLLLGQARITGIEVRTDPGRLRPSDVPVLRGSAEKIQQATGWRPRIAFEQTLVDLLEYWRQRTPARSR